MEHIGERTGASLQETSQPKPTFMIAGASKSGTTSLYAYVSQHPDVFMPGHKEPEFFIAPDGEVLTVDGLRGKHVNTNRVNTLADYQALFTSAKGELAVGEASANYLYMPGSAGRIQAYVPDAQIIFILRNPAERAFSAYLHHIRDGLEDKDFATALAHEERRIADGWSTLYHYRSKGYYYDQLCRFYNVFGKDQVHVFLYEDLKDDPVGLSQRIFKILGVDDTFVPDVGTKHNLSGTPKNATLQQLYRFLNSSNKSGLKSLGKQLLPARFRQTVKQGAMQRLEEINLSRTTMLPEVRLDLQGGYREDTEKLQVLIGRDLSGWLASLTNTTSC